MAGCSEVFFPAFADEEFAFISKRSECEDNIGVITEGSKKKTWETCQKIATAYVSGWETCQKIETTSWETCEKIATASVEMGSNLLSLTDLLVDPTTSAAEVSSRKRKRNANGTGDQQPPETQDYIYVRARRGQATDRHSLAERVRRKEINKRMMLLQSLVPGCSQITARAGVLDAIIDYIQSLQQQVEVLTMKCSLVTEQCLSWS